MIEIVNMTSPEIAEAIQNGYETAVFAIGSNEQHGPVLTVNTDSVLGDVLALRVAEKLGYALMYPTINFGCSEHHMMFPGTISLRKETLHLILKDYVSSLVRHGLKRIVILPSHGGNFGPLNEIVDDLMMENPSVKIVAYTDLMGFVEYLSSTSELLGVSPEESGAHAGESEVSMMMFANPECVRVEKIEEGKGYVGVFDENTTKKIFESGIAGLSPIGVLGDPSKSSSEHGKAYIESASSAIVDYINSQ